MSAAEMVKIYTYEELREMVENSEDEFEKMELQLAVDLKEFTMFD